MKKIVDFLKNNLHWWVLLGTAILCIVFISVGTKNEEGYYTIGGDVTITDNTQDFIKEVNKRLSEIMNNGEQTDTATTEEYDKDEVGLGFHTTLDEILARRLPDGDTDGGRGWQCSKYTAYLATGRREYSATHPDYGPVNGKDIAAWLVKNYGFKYISTPVPGAIGSAGFNTQYGHTAMYLGGNTVNDANYKPLAVATHLDTISNYVWVVPGDYNPQPTPTPTPTPTGEVSYTYKKGDTFGQVVKNLGLETSAGLWGANGDVRFYTNQLHKQGIYGNIPIGRTIYLTSR